MTILNSLIVPKNLKWGTLWDFQTSIMFQNIKKIEGGTLWYNQKIFEKSLSAEKNKVFYIKPSIVEKNQSSILNSSLYLSTRLCKILMNTLCLVTCSHFNSLQIE